MDVVSMPQEIPDIYCDQFQSSIGPYGCVLNFSVSQPIPPAPGSPMGYVRRATVRMSLEHLKVMLFILLRQVKQYETEQGVTVEVPKFLLNQLGIPLEDWEAVWGRREL
ncbi:MAG TPA: hypothetical protein GXX55_03105 [Firmicutes bacterium]|nr:hypothetical protein [Bacillota bacterium]